MYSGFTVTRFSGRVMGTHQKIDRVARKQLDVLLKGKRKFPGITSILQFEGKNGPDAIKRKSPARDEPWHYYSPFDKDDSVLIGLINDHYKNLVHELNEKNDERIAFEAAWLAHALVDGLTPAHHYPYEQEMIELRGGEGLETRTSIKEKWIFPGVTKTQKVRNNWKAWGPKGLISTHSFFEVGSAFLLAPLSLESGLPTKADIKEMQEIGYIEVFKNTAKEIAVLDIYHKYYRRGWTPRLALTIRQKLGPSMVKMVTLAWYSALIDSGIIKEPK